MGLNKGQFYIISAAIIILVLTLIQISLREYGTKNFDFEKSYNINYFNEIKREISISYFLENDRSIENFVDFLGFVEKNINEKRFDFDSVSVILLNTNNNPSKLNLTVVNFLDEPTEITFLINSTTSQEKTLYIDKKQTNSTLFDVSRNEDYKISFSTRNGFYEIKLDLIEKDLHVLFSEILIQGKNIYYIDKFEKHIFLQ
ncbi:MAG: hypothetical protein N3D75_00385 [Candidatus Aenigmarchaeota archaeon]|nr:hypothetical protein [Candidatus Aenigmarchaeota archaeon]